MKDAESKLTPTVLDEMQELGESFLGSNYDIYFNWSDDEIYCSELVWKLYDQAAGIRIAELKQLKDFDLTSSQVKQIMSERYGSNVPYEDSVIAPSDLFQSSKLMLVDPR